MIRPPRNRGGYVAAPVTAWIFQDHVQIISGTLVVQPLNRCQIRTLVNHDRDPAIVALIPHGDGIVSSHIPTFVNGRQAATGANNATSRVTDRPHQRQRQTRIGTGHGRREGQCRPIIRHRHTRRTDRNDIGRIRRVNEGNLWDDRRGNRIFCTPDKPHDSPSRPHEVCRRTHCVLARPRRTLRNPVHPVYE